MDPEDVFIPHKPVLPELKGIMSNTPTAKNTKIKKYGLAAGLLAGGMALGSVFAPVGIVNAQDSDDAENNTEEEENGRRGRGNKGAAVAELLGMSVEELKAAFEEGQTLAEIAATQGVSEDDLVSALVAAAEERVDQALESGRLSEDEAAEKTAGLEARITERVNAEPGEHGRHGRGGHGPRNRIGGEILDELGLDRDSVRAGFQADMSLAEIAAEAGISEADLVSALVDGAEARIDQAVEDGKITAEQAAEKKEGLEANISEKVNTPPSEREGRGGRPGGRNDG